MVQFRKDLLVTQDSQSSEFSELWIIVWMMSGNGKSLKGTFTNSEDPDEITHKVAFNHSLHHF